MQKDTDTTTTSGTEKLHVVKNTNNVANLMDKKKAYAMTRDEVMEIVKDCGAILVIGLSKGKVTHMVSDKTFASPYEVVGVLSVASDYVKGSIGE